MNKVIQQIRELVRTATNHGRRIRRLETLQTPITLARPLGGHIIQDEGVILTDRINLNFVGVRVEVTDDPGNSATLVTITDPAGDFCRVVPLDTGWRINAGQTNLRFLEHGTAFQLSDYGNQRGDYAIDLQQIHAGGYGGTDIAGAEYSWILGGEENLIHPDAWATGIWGLWNEINTFGGFEPEESFIIGNSNRLDGENYRVFAIGGSHSIRDVDYGVFLGHNNDAVGAFGVFAFIEGNDFTGNANDDPTYCAIGGILNEMEGDVTESFIFGESCKMLGDGTPGENVLWSSMFGFSHYMEHVRTNFALGQQTKSHRPTYDGFYDGRFVFGGDPINKTISDGTGYSGGYNQDSWFSQNDLITDWAAAWTTSRFEFPIITDSIWGFLIYIVGTEQGCNNSYMWKIEGVVENDGGTTTILGSTVTNIYRDVATKEWQVIADDPNDRLVLQFRDTAGADSNDCNIQISMLTMEVGFPA